MLPGGGADTDGPPFTTLRSHLPFTPSLAFAGGADADADADAGGGGGAGATVVSFTELLECIARCGVDKYAALLDTWLPTHGRMAMTRADAVRGMLQNVLGEADEQEVMREATIIRAERFDVTAAPQLRGSAQAFTLPCTPPLTPAFTLPSTPPSTHRRAHLSSTHT